MYVCAHVRSRARVCVCVCVRVFERARSCMPFFVRLGSRSESHTLWSEGRWAVLFCRVSQLPSKITVGAPRRWTTVHLSLAADVPSSEIGNSEMGMEESQKA